MVTMNGYPVIASFLFDKAPLTRAGRVIIVDRGPDEPNGRFVITPHFQTDGVWDNEWAQSSYATTIEGALIEFVREVEANLYPRMQRNSTKTFEFIGMVAEMKYDGEAEFEDDEPFIMENDDAVETLSRLIQEARELT